jgi:hypothetical protein
MFRYIQGDYFSGGGVNEAVEGVLLPRGEPIIGRGVCLWSNTPVSAV